MKGWQERWKVRRWWQRGRRGRHGAQRWGGRGRPWRGRTAAENKDSWLEGSESPYCIFMCKAFILILNIMGPAPPPLPHSKGDNSKVVLRIARSDKSDAILGLSSLQGSEPLILVDCWMERREWQGRQAVPARIQTQAPWLPGKGPGRDEGAREHLCLQRTGDWGAKRRTFAPVVRCEVSPTTPNKNRAEEVKRGLLKQSQEDRAKGGKAALWKQAQVRVSLVLSCTWKDHVLRYIVTAKNLRKATW